MRRARNEPELVPVTRVPSISKNTTPHGFAGNEFFTNGVYEAEPKGGGRPVVCYVVARFQ